MIPSCSSSSFTLGVPSAAAFLASRLLLPIWHWQLASRPSKWAAASRVQCSAGQGGAGGGNTQEVSSYVRYIYSIYIHNAVAHIQSASRASDLTEMNSSLMDDGCAGCSISHPVSPSHTLPRVPNPVIFPVAVRSDWARAGQGVVVTSEKCATSTRRGAATQASLSLSLPLTHVSSSSSSSSAINDIWAPLCATIRLNNGAGVSQDATDQTRPETRDPTRCDERVRITYQS